MIASWCVGKSVLPDCLGLACHDFAALKAHYFVDFELSSLAASSKKLDFSRMLERDDLINLLRHYSRPHVVETDWIIGLLVAGCLGEDHLWHDLGLWSRTQLTALLHYNFPELAARNTHDMKWKKFLYKQLCEMEGLYLCRAPSCAVCVDYHKCYGSEESVIDRQPTLNDNGSYLAN
jgi:nitrogen fixation protein NifQ